MDLKALRAMDAAALTALLAERREELRALRFRVRAAEEKDVRRIREVRTEIARIQTVLTQQRASMNAK